MKWPLLSRWIVKLLVIGIAAVVIFNITPLRGMWKSTARFSACRADLRVHYEQGVEKVAEIVASALPQAIASVESQQYRAFAKPIAVYICASDESFASYGGPRSAGGFILNGRLFLSTKPQNTRERLPRLLTHELSHLQLEQQLGMVRFALDIPSWFKEGLAVLVSSGGGAETVSEAEANAAVAAGHSFDPAMSGRLILEKSGRSYGLSEHMWYRQSALLVKFLRDKDEAKFRRLLLSLEDGRGFEASLEEAYSEKFGDLLSEFRSEATSVAALLKTVPNQMSEPPIPPVTPAATAAGARGGLAAHH